MRPTMGYTVKPCLKKLNKQKEREGGREPEKKGKEGKRANDK